MIPNLRWEEEKHAKTADDLMMQIISLYISHVQAMMLP